MTATESTAAIQAFWHNLRKGRKAKQATIGRSAISSRGVWARGRNLSQALAAHRELIEHQYFAGNRKRIQLIRAAARAFDKWAAAEKAARPKNRGGRARGGGIHVPSRKERAA